jgi:PqqA peptide cyclase
LLEPGRAHARSGELDTAEWARVFREAAALGVLQLHLSGGEPTARRDIVEMVTAASRAGLYTNLITAGVLLMRRAGRAGAAGLDHVQLSVQDATRAPSASAAMPARTRARSRRRARSPRPACR